MSKSLPLSEILRTGFLNKIKPSSDAQISSKTIQEEPKALSQNQQQTRSKDQMYRDALRENNPNFKEWHQEMGSPIDLSDVTLMLDWLCFSAHSKEDKIAHLKTRFKENASTKQLAFSQAFKDLRFDAVALLWDCCDEPGEPLDKLGNESSLFVIRYYYYSWLKGSDSQIFKAFQGWLQDKIERIDVVNHLKVCFEEDEFSKNDFLYYVCFFGSKPQITIKAKAIEDAWKNRVQTGRGLERPPSKLVYYFLSRLRTESFPGYLRGLEFLGINSEKELKERKQYFVLHFLGSLAVIIGVGVLLSSALSLWLMVGYAVLMGALFLVSPMKTQMREVFGKNQNKNIFCPKGPPKPLYPTEQDEKGKTPAFQEQEPPNPKQNKKGKTPAFQELRNMAARYIDSKALKELLEERGQFFPMHNKRLVQWEKDLARENVQNRFHPLPPLLLKNTPENPGNKGRKQEENEDEKASNNLLHNDN